jgi:hypothetical protein
MQKKYVLLILIIIITIVSTLYTIPKVKIIEDYKNKALNPIDNGITQMDKLFGDLGDLANIKMEHDELKQSKSIMHTAIELCLFKNSVFSDIFIYVLITSVLYIFLTVQSTWLIINGAKNHEDILIIIVLVVTLLIALVFGTYFVGILIIMIAAIISGLISLVKG